MNTVDYTLTVTTRVSAATGPQVGNHTRTHQVLPGATVRGAFAAAWWRAHGNHRNAAAVFAGLFDTGLKVGQAVPAQARLIPASVLVCKYQPETDCAGFWLDQAVAAAKQARPRAECRACGGPVTTRPGWDTTSSVTTTRLTSTQLTAAETAEAGRLFSRDALRVDDRPDRQLRFSGRLHVPDPAEVAWLDQQVVQVGAKRSLSYGLATVTLTPTPAAAAPTPGPQMIVQLASPTILVDAYGAADISTGAVLAELQRVSGDPLRVVSVDGPAAWLRTELVTGWHMRSALPKPADWALAAGSCVLVSGLTTTGAARLEEGIGYRTAEGYGQVELLDPATLPDFPPSDGVAAVRSFRAVLSPARRGQAIGAARQGLRRVRDAHAAGTDPAPVITATLGSVKNLLGVERAALERLLRLRPGDLDDAVEELR